MFSSDRAGTNQIYTVSAWGTGMTQVTDFNVDALDPTFTPNGKRIVFDANFGSLAPRLYSVDRNGEHLVEITDARRRGDIFPAISPDGKRIAFACGSAPFVNGICAANADGSGVERVIDTDGNDWEPTWSPDGRRIAFASAQSGNYDIYVVGLDGSNLERLTPTPGRDADPAWSPSGGAIAFDSDRSGTTQLFVMDEDGSDVRQITDTDYQAVWPAWSPDAKEIAFQGGRWIHVLDLQSGEIRQVTD